MVWEPSRHTPWPILTWPESENPLSGVWGPFLEYPDKTTDPWSCCRFTCKIEFNSFASNMIKQSVNETKWSSLLARTRAFILYISIPSIWLRARKLAGPFEKRAPGEGRVFLCPGWSENSAFPIFSKMLTLLSSISGQEKFQAGRVRWG